MSSPEEVMDVIDEGKANRHVAVTSKPLLFFDVLLASLPVFVPPPHLPVMLGGSRAVMSFCVLLQT